MESTWAELRSTLTRLGSGELVGADRFLRDTLADLDAKLVEYGEGSGSVVALLREDLEWAKTVANKTVHEKGKKLY